MQRMNENYVGKRMRRWKLVEDGRDVDRKQDGGTRLKRTCGRKGVVRRMDLRGESGAGESRMGTQTPFEQEKVGT